MSGKDTRIEMPAMAPAVCLTEIQAKLRKAFEQRNLDQFCEALASGADPLIRETLFEMICQEPGTSAFLEACIKSGISDTPNTISGSQAINFLTKSLDSANLKMFLGYFPETDVNVTIDDDSPINFIVKNVTKENSGECFECVKILVEHGANVNIHDILEFTSNSKVSGREEIINYLKQHCQKLDEFRDKEARDIPQTRHSSSPLPVQSEFDYFAKHLMDLESLNNSERQEQEEKFLSELREYFNGTKSEEEKKELVKQKDNNNETLLGKAIQVGFKEAVKEILRGGADPNGGGSTRPILIACIKGQSEILEELLNCKEIDANFSDEPPLCFMVKELANQPETSNSNYLECFKKLLNHSKVDINQRDKSGSTALHFAVWHKQEEAIRDLLKRNTYLGTRNIFQDLPITDIKPSLLEEYFDSRITQKKGQKAGDDDLEIKFDYSCFVPLNVCETAEKFAEEMIPIYEMTKSTDLRSLLKHPLISSYLFLKWHRLRPIFYANLILYSISSLSIILYILLCYGREVSDGLRVFMLIISSFGVLFIFVREASQLITAPLQYFRQVENYLEMAIIGISIFVLSGYSVTDYTRRVIAAVLILLSAVEFSLLVGSLSHLSISTHMVMLKTVSITYMRSLMLYSILLIAFAFCFYTLLGGVANGSSAQVEDEFNNFVDPGTAIIKTIVMMTGEFEAANIEFKSHTLSYIFFLLFVFFISIVLFNLLNGLAVSDTQAIKAEAELTGFIIRAEVLRRYEKLVFQDNPALFRLISRLCDFPKNAQKSISLFPFYLRKSVMVLNLKQRNRIYKYQDKNPSTSRSVGSEGSQENDSLILRPLTNLSCWFGYDKYTSLDGKIVRYTKQVLKKKQWTDETKQEKLRLENIEKQLTENHKKLELLLRDRI